MTTAPFQPYLCLNEEWPTPGLYPEGTREMYDKLAFRADEDGHLQGHINRGLFGTFNRCPEKAEYEIFEAKDEDDKDTSAMRRGRALHHLVLEPDKFESQWAIAPEECEEEKYKNSSKETQPCTNPAKHRAAGVWYCGVHAPEETDDVDVLKGETADRVSGMAQALKQNPSTKRYLDRMLFAEPTLLWQDPDSGLPMRSRLDGIAAPLDDEDGINLLEVKTVTHASKKSIERKMTQTDGWLQDPLYTKAFKTVTQGDEEFEPVKFIYLCVEEKPPHVVQCYRYTPETRETMRRHVKGQLGRFAWCLDEERWPKGYEGDPVAPLSIPNWARRDLNMPR